MCWVSARALLSIALVWAMSSASFDQVLCIKADGHAAIELATTTGTCLPDITSPSLPLDTVLIDNNNAATHPGCGICKDIFIVNPFSFRAVKTSGKSSIQLKPCLNPQSPKANVGDTYGQPTGYPIISISKSAPAQQGPPLRIWSKMPSFWPMHSHQMGLHVNDSHRVVPCPTRRR